MMRGLVTGLAATLFGSLFAACSLERNMNPSLNPGELQTPVEQFADMPVPRELRLISGVNQSRSYHRASFRSAFLEYEGPITIAGLRRFLHDRLPAHGWALVREEDPTRERVVQRWLHKKSGGVQQVLVAELRDSGGRCRLSYDLRTRRSFSVVAADSPRGAAAQVTSGGTTGGTPDAANGSDVPKGQVGPNKEGK